MINTTPPPNDLRNISYAITAIDMNPENTHANTMIRMNEDALVHFC